ncbi:alpha-ketoacid dehydrogenase subunit beta [Agrobacterium rhizogenes]|uniref:Acetoin dehydrogenase E1 beta subunit n=1 Tax=Rhizobium rhizogenes NBRC 13257 TaxID=1220581 RepID=A0AA87QIL1_RHIRH|nr:alpha-ketoacid dehydrogenase subunit beta [Rhizobium rhizogenes]NTG65140.1 alpha-ketoacid dehydrogenase subunit beta [Rhizobium rhizogenes]NTG71679.1 alpha-ketoacid dehydrogenase subunit beta [Rhizobium rhizogenes]NTG84490.1 alpha-ketoacid dehydrogenase subunit beta [Rhizobium rhizogenes]NTG90881.1 alpha-ketoacid dehydrogenase subunit beta [Rhizobium rhizogenes]NTH29750.1 alpha-ketoacid dehydrogenase subunit beta [Rhizobium rhizogenes]
MAEVRFLKAVNQALHDAMRDDPTVILIGEDIAAAGGSFKATKGLLDTYGSSRVFDAPIAEAAIAGIAVGAALTGAKPVAEIMFMDFVTLTMDMLVNQAAKARSMFGGQGSVPMVLRTQHGGGLSAGPQHSQCLEAWFAHIPGLKVVVPATPADAYSLLRAAIDDPDPVIVVEHKALYAIKGELPDEPERVEIGKGRIVRPGNDATVVAYGAMVAVALEAAEELANGGPDVEVIDLRSIQPWDEALVLDSLGRTHRLVITHEAVEAFGVGAEIAARMADIGFDELDAPIIRVAAPFAPVPFSPALEKHYRPAVKDIVAALRRVCA